MTFHTPEPVTMVQREAEQAGYSARTTSNRLVLRSPYHKPETYSEDVSNKLFELESSARIKYVLWRVGPD